MKKDHSHSAYEEGVTPLFAEKENVPDPTKFKYKHPSDTPLYNLLLKNVQDVPEAKNTNPFTLEEAWGSTGKRDKVIASGKIVFHVVGDTGSTRGPQYQNEVTDKLAADFNETDEADEPAFLFHLGDVVYSFGESQYYYDQFYEPYRNYPAPIVAIPGNHDGMVYKGDQQPTLGSFLRNFVSETPVHTPECGTLLRTAMIQPGVYFCLDAPFVSIIGLYSNALEDPGVISPNTGGKKADNMDNRQIEFLTKHLTRLKNVSKTAIIIAVHHPPFAGGGRGHGGSPAMLEDIDNCCKETGLWPHAVLSGHAHNYQRYTRTIDNMDIPFIVCGNSGHNIQKMSKSGPLRTPDTVSDELIFENYDDSNYGYLRCVCDGSQLRIEYHDADATQKSPSDMVTVDLKTRTMVSN